MWRTTFAALQTEVEKIFQSTSPVWRTTQIAVSLGMEMEISIHVPRVEDDNYDSLAKIKPVIFQSTSPVWRTTAILH